MNRVDRPEVLASIPELKTEKPDHAAWAMALLCGIVLGIPIYCSRPGPARDAARGEVAAPIQEPFMIAAEPEPKRGIAPDEPSLLIDGRPIPDPRLILRLQNWRDDVRRQADGTPPEWRWQLDNVQLQISLLIRDLEAGRLDEQ